MITQKEYLEAEKVVAEYKEQLRITKINHNNQLNQEREKKYRWCEQNGGHEYRPSGGKWSSVTQISCIDCGKTKE